MKAVEAIVYIYTEDYKLISYWKTLKYLCYVGKSESHPGYHHGKAEALHRAILQSISQFLPLTRSTASFSSFVCYYVSSPSSFPLSRYNNLESESNVPENAGNSDRTPSRVPYPPFHVE